MTKLGRCSACDGFVPERASACPHCKASGSTWRKLGALGVAIGGGAIAFTLMACYGRAPCPDGDRDCYGPRPTGTHDAGNDNPVAKDPTSAPVASDGGKK